MDLRYDVIVIGGGHAGCEAAAAAARLGARTLLISGDLGRLAQMSCNPAIGGIAKGQIVREIDALGGLTGIVTDRTAIQFRMLNRSKGPAVWSPRAQSDRVAFMAEWRRQLEAIPGLQLFQDMVTELVVSEPDAEGKRRVEGVRTALGIEFSAPEIILTAGTFLNGKMHFGRTKLPGGRISEQASFGLSDQLESLGLRRGRMKTGTPARIDGRSIDFNLCDIQWGDDAPVGTRHGASASAQPDASSDESAPDSSVEIARRDHHKFSFLPQEGHRTMTRPCFIVHTNPECHRILHDNLADSPLYNGDIQSIGPRYCPSIETKIVTFADKESHQLFLEPEGADTYEYYINGFSSSLPWQVQLEALRQIPALRNVQFLRPGYAIEYDYFDPTQLRHSLESRVVEGLWLAGQVNGTTGYEEAAAQGLMAGINAARSIKGEEPVVLGRDRAYIGVLIDDLVTKGVDEPYRMFTSRAEYRILLRQDDADMRLTDLGYEIGTVSEERKKAKDVKEGLRNSIITLCKDAKIKCDEKVNEWLKSKGTSPISSSQSLESLVKRPQLSLISLTEICPPLRVFISFLPSDILEEVVEAAEILIKYDGYIQRERETAERNTRLDYVRIPDEMDFNSISALSTEARQKLTSQRPQTIGQASRIPGVSPSDISVLLLLLRN